MERALIAGGNPKRVPLRPKVSASVGGAEPSFVGAEALLDFHVQVTCLRNALVENL